MQSPQSSLLQLCEATGLGLHTPGLLSGPRQLEASSGSSLQLFGDRAQSRLPLALGTFKETELWGRQSGKVSGVDRVGDVGVIWCSSVSPTDFLPKRASLNTHSSS